MEKYLRFPKNLFLFLAVVSYCFFCFGLEISHNSSLIQKSLILLDGAFWIWKPRTQTYKWYRWASLLQPNITACHSALYKSARAKPSTSTSGWSRDGRGGRRKGGFPLVTVLQFYCCPINPLCCPISPRCLENIITAHSQVRTIMHSRALFHLIMHFSVSDFNIQGKFSCFS